jgi:S1-C subfamily serine protease
MKRAVFGAVAVVLLLPALTAAVPRPPARRLDPNKISEAPSYVGRVRPSIVGLKVRAADDAPSSARLGVHRFASGVLFDARGYVVTVSYAVMDAVALEAETSDRGTVPARLVAIDFDTGLAVVKLDADGPWPAATLGDSRDVKLGELTGTVGVDEENDLVYVTGELRAVRRFSAYWEYMLDRALFVSPSSPSWGGSAVVDASGRVIGLASLRLGEPPYVNVAIPVEKLQAVKDELIAAGRVVSHPPRPWLGLYTIGGDDSVVVDGFAASGPARVAGFKRGDRIVRVNGVAVTSQEDFYEQLWRARAGDLVEVAVERANALHVIRVRSVDRYDVIVRPKR